MKTTCKNEDKTCKNCAVCAHLTLERYNLFSASHKTIFLAYKYLVTLLTIQVGCERSFSILNWFKNKRRKTLTQEHTGHFVQMAVERGIVQKIPNNDIIYHIATHSSLIERNYSLNKREVTCFQSLVYYFLFIILLKFISQSSLYSTVIIVYTVYTVDLCIYSLYRAYAWADCHNFSRADFLSQSSPVWH